MISALSAALGLDDDEEIFWVTALGEAMGLDEGVSSTSPTMAPDSQSFAGQETQDSKKARPTTDADYVLEVDTNSRCKCQHRVRLI